MLSIGKLGRGQENYYLSTVAKGIEDYYTGSGEAPGEWTGAGAARLGLQGQVTDEHLRQVLGGIDPRTGDKLGGHTRTDRVPGWDLTFSAPKSVSVLYALGDREVPAQVAEAHRAAVAAGIEYLERHATVTRRRVDGEVELVRGEGLVVAAFRHRTSRAGDPQLHTHCLVGNVVERVGGGWGAVHSRPIYQHARTAGFVYQAVLRGELTDRLGVEWGEIVNGYADIDGIDRRLLECFSKRREEIEAAMAARGEDSMSASRTATLDTRQAKDYDVDPETLHERWRAEAADLGEELADLSRVVGRQGPQFRASDLDDVADDMLTSRGLTAEHASFDRRDVMRSWCVGLPAGARVDVETLEELVEGVIEDDRVLPVIDATDRLADRQVLRRPDGSITTAVAVERRWSTTEMLAIEQRLFERAERGRGVGVGVVDDQIVAAACAGSLLSAEQEHMVRHLTTSGNGVDVVVGRAGTGKTYALAAAARAWRDGGLRPIGVAIAARAAAELEASAGLPSTTIEQFLIDCDQSGGSLNRQSVVVVDEAGMVDTRRLARVLAHVDASGAKAVLVGDHHQLPAVEAGGAFASLVRRHDAVELTENRRQVEAWERAALDQLRVGRGGRHGLVTVVDRYESEGRLHLGENPREVRAAMVADWFESRTQGEQPIMLALRRRDVDELNARARALLVEAGAIDAQGVTIAGRPFAAGDRIVCLHNDRRVGVHNAMFGSIEAIDDDGFVVKVDGAEHRLNIPTSYVADGHLTHAYATTIHKAQGATYERALLLGDDRLYRQAGYTGLSRGRERNDIYLVAEDDRDRDIELEEHGQHENDAPSERFVRALVRDGAKTTAVEERCGLRSPSAGRTLADLWSERDAIVVEPAAVDGDELYGRRLERAIAQRTALAGLAAEIDRPDHVVSRLGEPPLSLGGREKWRAAAGEIESYVARWGSEPGEPPPLAADPQLDHLDIVRDLIGATTVVIEAPEVGGVELD
ncbi:MAG TPA: MobF family relaxase [Acidimicrobiales bacterium]|nr:MobF family relaxase [Acidimicrobiales bacterium]